MDNKSGDCCWKGVVVLCRFFGIVTALGKGKQESASSGTQCACAELTSWSGTVGETCRVNVWDKCLWGDGLTYDNGAWLH